MNSIKLSDYVISSVKLDYPAHFKWLIGMFSYIVDDYEDDFFIVKDKTFSVKLPGENTTNVYLLTDDYKEPILTPNTKIYLPKDTIANLKEDIETTVGRFLANYLLLARVFKDKIPYINNPFTVSDIENKYIVKKLVSQGDESKNPDGITISEYVKFVESISYIVRLNRFIVHAGSPIIATRPDNVEQYRKKLIEEAKKKYGEDAMERLDVVGEIDKKLEQYIKEHTDEDPVLTPKISGKTLSAMKKMYASYGHGGDFFYNDGKAHYLEKSLEEGWDETKEAITILYNDIRMGSYKRGAETQKGGYTAKQGLRATTDLKIIKGDCKSKVGLPVKITNDNYKNYIGRYMLQNGKPVLLTEDNIKNYINKIIEIRSPMFCHMEQHFCSTCMGENVKNYENGVSIMVINAAGVILNSSMKAFHESSVKLTKLDLEDLL